MVPTPRYFISRIALAQVLADLRARRRGQHGRGAFLPDLLVTALQRAIALAEMDGAAAAVAEDLDFDVARLLEIFLEIDRASPKADFASFAAVDKATRRSASLCATFMPRPPPPAAAFTSTEAIFLAIAIASSSGPTAPSEPGTTGMPSFLAVFLASILSPIRRICSALGPMKCRLCSPRISAKRAFSDRKP